MNAPLVDTLPILAALFSVNQRFLSGPVVIPYGLLAAVGTVNSVSVPVGVIRPMRLPRISVNHMLPSDRARYSPARSPNAAAGTP